MGMRATVAGAVILAFVGSSGPAAAQVAPFPSATVSTVLEQLARNLDLGTIEESAEFTGTVTPERSYADGKATQAVELSGTGADAGVSGSGSISGSPCPDATGTVRGTIKAYLDEGGGANATHDELTVKFTGTVDDAGRLTGFTSEARFNGGLLNEPTTRRLWRTSSQGKVGKAGKRASRSTRTVTVTEAGDATRRQVEKEAKSTAAKAEQLVRAYLKEAERARRSGKCVDYKVVGASISGTFTGVKCGGLTGEWRLRGVIDQGGGVRREDMISVTLNESGTGSFSDVSEVFTEGIPGSTGGEVGGSASYNAAAKVLSLKNPLAGVLDLTVSEGSFCKDGKPA